MDHAKIDLKNGCPVGKPLIHGCLQLNSPSLNDSFFHKLQPGRRCGKICSQERLNVFCNIGLVVSQRSKKRSLQ